VAEARRALEVDPLSLPVNQMLGLVLRRAGRYDEAIEQYRRTLELDPGYAMAVENIGQAYAGKGLAQQAVEAFLKADALAGKDPAQLRALRLAYERRGMPGFLEERARATIAAGWDGWHWVTPQIAEACAILGRHDEAMKWLEKAYTARSASLLWIDPDWPEMRSDPRFQDLLGRIGLPRRDE
jgi:tetratricopeptide (TPR) repeat protein